MQTGVARDGEGMEQPGWELVGSLAVGAAGAGSDIEVGVHVHGGP